MPLGWRKSVALAAIACALLAGCRTPPPLASVGAGQASVEQLLAQARTEGELTLHLGPPPTTCVETGPGTKLCEWRIGDVQPAWEPIAAAIGADDKVNVLCEIPDEGLPREPGSCVAFPRRSDRYLYGGSKLERERAESAAKERVQSARTLVEISHLLGAAPLQCGWLRKDARLCTWAANSRTYGHGTLAVGLGLSTRKQFKYRCELPADGSPRKLESCRWD
jgi:hypothetical protein